VARDVNMEKDELLDECFENPGRMLRAFADMLPTRAGSNKVQFSKTDPASKQTRCFNCNGKGHWPRECAKPNRAPEHFYQRMSSMQEAGCQ